MKLLRLLFRTFPRAVEAAHLRWALNEIPALHPDVPFIVRRLRELEN